MIARFGHLLSRAQGRQAGLPETHAYPGIVADFNVYVIGDIHGRIDLLTSLQAAIDADCAATGKPGREIYVGDYVDRGGNSAAVLDCLVERKRARSAICLAGNHEHVFLEAISGLIDAKEWYKYGGRETILSYGLDPNDIVNCSTYEMSERLKRAVPSEHIAFLLDLDLWHAVGDYVIVHAGLRPGVLLEKQERKDLLWIRDTFLSSKKNFGFVVVHGHTPVNAPDFQRNRINVDTGAYLSNRLTCLKIDGSGATVLKTG